MFIRRLILVVVFQSYILNAATLKKLFQKTKSPSGKALLVVPMKAEKNESIFSLEMMPLDVVEKIAGYLNMKDRTHLTKQLKRLQPHFAPLCDQSAFFKRNMVDRVNGLLKYVVDGTDACPIVKKHALQKILQHEIVPILMIDILEDLILMERLCPIQDIVEIKSATKQYGFDEAHAWFERNDHLLQEKFHSKTVLVEDQILALETILGECTDDDANREISQDNLHSDLRKNVSLTQRQNVFQELLDVFRHYRNEKMLFIDVLPYLESFVIYRHDHSRFELERLYVQAFLSGFNEASTWLKSALGGQLHPDVVSITADGEWQYLCNDFSNTILYNAAELDAWPKTYRDKFLVDCFGKEESRSPIMWFFSGVDVFKKPEPSARRMNFLKKLVEFSYPNQIISERNPKKNYRTAIMLAAESDNFAVFQALLSYGDKESLTARDDAGNTVLHLAARSSSLEILTLICNTGGSDLLLLKNNDGATPLHLAVQYNTVDMISFLLRNGAGKSISSPSTNGKTPIFIAIERGDVEILETLLKYCDDSCDGHKIRNVLKTRLKHFRISEMKKSHRMAKLLEKYKY